MKYEIRKSVLQNIELFCKDNNLSPINIRGVYKKNKAKIFLTLICSECGSRFDIQWESLKQQKYRDLCTKCAHRRSTEYKTLNVDSIIKRFEQEGFRVITPKDKIKRHGGRSIYNTTVQIENKYGNIYSTNCNNFCTNIDYYRKLSNIDNKMYGAKSRYEYFVREFLKENNIPFKQEFVISDCKNVAPLRFDFALYYNTDNFLLIEVDGEQHFGKGGLFGEDFKSIIKRDKIKNYYCEKHKIPLLRIPYNAFKRKNNDYKNMILEFVQNNR